MAHVVIGTRGDQLAVQQANWIKQRLEQAHAGLLVGVEILRPESDEAADWQSTADLALLARRVDAVVHHLSDLPARLPEDFHLAAITERLDARDALVANAPINTLAGLPAQTRIVAHGWQRRVQLVAAQPQLQFVENRDTLDVQLQKLAAGEFDFDALVTDAFSLSLLNAQDRVTLWLATSEFIPAAGQGAFALQSRLEDQRTNLLLESLNHHATRFAVNAERAVVRNLYGEPGDPLAAHATLTDDAPPQLSVIGLVGDAALPVPPQLIRGSAQGEPRTGEMLGSALAVQLLNAGARSLLNRKKMVAAQAQPAFDFAQAFSNAYDFETDVDEIQPLALAASSASGFAVSTSRVSAFTDDTALEFDLVATKVRRLREQQPLNDQRILLTRTGRNHAELVQKLEALGAQVFTAPPMSAATLPDWHALDKALVHLSWYDWLIFASPHSVAACLQRLTELGHHRQELEARRLCAVGKATADSLGSTGFQADLVLPNFSAAALAAAWETRFGKREALRGKTVAFFAAQHFAEEFIRSSRHPVRLGFDQLGVYIEAIATYRVAIPDNPLAEVADFDYALIHSAAALENLALCYVPRPLAEVLRDTRIICLNEAAASAARAQGLGVHLRAPETHPRGLAKLLREDCLQKHR